MVPTVFMRGERGQFPNYQRALEATGFHSVLSLSLEDARACDALVLPGGGDMEPWRYGQANAGSREMDGARDEAELLLLELFTARRRPVLGICRGLQTINVFFGGTLIQDLPGHSACGGIDRLHTVRARRGGPGALWGEAAIVNSSHHQAADRLGAGLDAVQWTADGTVEALCHRALPVWAVQWHPERMMGNFAKAGAADGSVLFRAWRALCVP